MTKVASGLSFSFRCHGDAALKGRRVRPATNGCVIPILLFGDAQTESPTTWERFGLGVSVMSPGKTPAHSFTFEKARMNSVFLERRFTAAMIFAALMWLVPGCSEPEAVRVYTVPTQMPEQLKPPMERTLAAMIPLGETVWFVKVKGPEAAVSEIESEYRKFVEAFEVSDGKPNTKDLPEGWRLGASKPMRVASIDVETKTKQLDISISTLSRLDDWDEMVQMNVNRWRTQVGLDESNEKWAGASAIDIAAGDGQSIWVDITGDPSKASGSMTPPFAGGMSRGMPSGPQRQSPQAPPSSEQREPPLKFDRPDGWRDGRMSSMRMAAFNVGPEESAAELTVIPAGGDLRGNVARWLGQVRGGEVPDDVVDKALADAKQVDVDGRESQRFLLLGSDDNTGQAIDVTIVPMNDGISLFVKMQGPVQTVTDQDGAITSFLESLKLKI